MRGVVYTIGHSTHPIDDFVELLQIHFIGEIIDVRTVPRSRRNPQFNRDTLPESLVPHDILYRHMPGLGGLRHTRVNSPNAGWDNASFRGYADYMQTGAFWANLDELIATNNETNRRLAIMCAESLWWQCHRRMIADALLIRGMEVLHIMGKGEPRAHELTAFARITEGTLVYPAP